MNVFWTDDHPERYALVITRVPTKLQVVSPGESWSKHQNSALGLATPIRHVKVDQIMVDVVKKRIPQESMLVGKHRRDLERSNLRACSYDAGD